MFCAFQVLSASAHVLGISVHLLPEFLNSTRRQGMAEGSVVCYRLYHIECVHVLTSYKYIFIVI